MSRGFWVARKSGHVICSACLHPSGLDVDGIFPVPTANGPDRAAFDQGDEEFWLLDQDEIRQLSDLGQTVECRRCDAKAAI
jgi:hypothetical protein